MASIYQSTLSQAWTFTKKVKALWLLGLLAALPGGSGGEYERFFNLQQFEDTRGLVLGLFERGEATKFSDVFSVFNFFVRPDNLTYTIFALLILLAFILLSMLAQGGLVSSILQLNKKKPWKLTDGFVIGGRYLGRVLLLNIISRVLVYGTLLILGLPVLLFFRATEATFWSQVFYAIYFLALIPLDVVISFVVRYAIVYMISEGQGVWQSFTSAWHLFRRNWILSLEVALFLFLVSLGLGLIVLLIAGVILQGMIVYIGLLNLWFLLILLVVLFAGGVLAAFQYSVWTLLAVELMKNGGESKLEEFARNVAQTN